MRKIVGLVGSSGSGKTTLIEKLVPQLKQRGYRVGTVKHAGHGFEMDREGKDTWRYQQSGADSVIVSSPGKMVLSRQGIPDRLHAILPFLADMDIVLVEGFKKEPIPKIEVFRSAVAQSPLCLSDPRLKAVVSDDVLQTGIPIIGLEDVERIVTLIEGLPDEEMSGLGE
jgi:molybdopterin-guanine dinucleotide biosynthesis protein B